MLIIGIWMLNLAISAGNINSLNLPCLQIGMQISIQRQLTCHQPNMHASCFSQFFKTNNEPQMQTAGSPYSTSESPPPPGVRNGPLPRLTPPPPPAPPPPPTPLPPLPSTRAENVLYVGLSTGGVSSGMAVGAGGRKVYVRG